MTTVMTTTPGGDMGDLARAVQWARLLVDAAFPLDALLPSARPDTIPVSVEVVETDRLQQRAEAFAQVLAQIIEGEWTARPSDLERLTRGQMPAPKDPREA